MTVDALRFCPPSANPVLAVVLQLTSRIWFGSWTLVGRRDFSTSRLAVLGCAPRDDVIVIVIVVRFPGRSRQLRVVECASAASRRKSRCLDSAHSAFSHFRRAVLIGRERLVHSQSRPKDLVTEGRRRIVFRRA